MTGSAARIMQKDMLRKVTNVKVTYVAGNAVTKNKNWIESTSLRLYRCISEALLHRRQNNSYLQYLQLRISDNYRRLSSVQGSVPTWCRITVLAGH